MKSILFNFLLISLFFPLALNQFPVLELLNVVKIFTKPIIFRFIDNSIGGTECAIDVKTIINEAFDLKIWALKILDATAKINSGIGDGNFRFFGNFDQCLSVSQKIGNKIISGQHCTIPLVLDDNELKFWFDFGKRQLELQAVDLPIEVSDRHLDLFLKYYKVIFGLCVPKSCSPKNLEQVYSYFAKPFKIPVQAGFDEELCSYRGKPVVSYPVDFWAYIFFAVILVLVLAGTIYDLCQQNQNNPHFLQSFSLCSNYKNLLLMQPEDESLSCRHGLKVITMVWIIVGHLAMTKALAPISNGGSWSTQAELQLEGLILAVPYGWDTFFTLSGLTVMYVLLKESEPNGGFGVHFRRFLSFIPPLLATILVYISIIKHLFDGPLWPFLLEKFTTDCVNNGWVTLFGFSNLINYDEICLTQSWFWSINTQLYIISPIILYYFKINPVKACYGVAAICGISIVYTSVMVSIFNLGFVMPLEMNEPGGFYVFQNTFSRMPAWLIGACCGFFLYKHKATLKLPKNLNFLIWTTSLSTIAGLVFYQQFFLLEETDILRSILLNSISRLLWASSICFITISCSSGHGGLMNQFLSHPVFIILSKLTFCIFLTYFGVINIFLGNRKHSENIDAITLLSDVCGCFVGILTSSVVLWLVFEAPTLALVKQWEIRRTKKSNEKTD